METFINKIKKLGESISLKNTKSLVFLDNPQYVWMVASGRLNLFAVATENGSPRGARMPLFTVEEGSIVFPPGSTTGKTGITTLATGDPSTDLISIKLPQFVDIAGKGPFSGTACRILDKWIGDVLSYMSHELPPDDCTGVEPGADIRVEANKTFKSSGGILWCEIYEGLAALPGDETAIKLKKGVIFPVSDNTWLRACDNLKIKVISTGDFIKTPAFTGSLFSFNKIFLNYMILKRDRDIKADRERLQKRKAHDEELTKKALYEIASPLLPKSRQYLFEETDDHLLSACKLIGKQTGITFSRPVETEHKRGAGESIIEDMDSIARASRIKKRKVMLRDDWWRKDNGPLLAFKRGEADHPLALIQLSPTEYAVFDPVYKTRQKVNRKIAQSIEPGAYTFFCPLPERKLSFWDLLKYSLKGSGQSIATIFLMGLLAALLGLVVPIATGIIFNTVIPNAEIGLLWQLTLILTACAIGTVAFEITQSVAVLRLQGKTESSLQAAVWDRLMSLRASFFRNYTSGDLALRGLGIGALRSILSLSSAKALIASLFSLLNFLLLFHYSPFLAWICAAILLVSIILMIPLMLIMLYKQIQVINIDGKISGMLLQFITGVSKLRVTGSEKRAFAVWAKDFSRKKLLTKHAHICQNILTTLQGTLPIFSLIIIFAVIAFKFMKTTSIPIGNYMAFIAAYTTVQIAMLQMSVAVTTWLYVIPVYKRMKPILSALPEYNSEKPPPGRLTGSIEINHVNFRYQKDGPVIINDVSLSAGPGEFIAITGSSGSGKSTLLRLLLGFDMPDSGSIYYDGKDLSKFDLGEFRRQIGVVLQNGSVLQNSILENIVGSSGLGIDEAWAAAELAGCKKDIEEMPMKMLTIVTSGGGTISGGQMQRIIIARALVRKPRIVLFDEATSSLDNATQDIVTKSLENLRATRIVIAHRLSTIKKADRIYVLDKGRIVQSGKYEDLIKQEGVFALLAKRQII